MYDQYLLELVTRLHMEVFMDAFTVYADRGIKVDKSKIDIITSLPNLTSMRKVDLFLGHKLKIQLTSTPILQAPNWEYPSELICEASNSILGVVLGQRVRVGKHSHVIAYVS
ncbi:hypothetical protein CR513_09858, partial [Mucuna pruriens]